MDGKARSHFKDFSKYSAAKRQGDGRLVGNLPQLLNQFAADRMLHPHPASSKPHISLEHLEHALVESVLDIWKGGFTVLRMSIRILPEAVQMRPSVAIKLSAWAGIAVIVSFLSRWWLSRHGGANDVLRSIVALAPIFPGILWARTVMRWVRQLDELQRQIQYEAWFFATMGTVFTITILGLVASAGVLQSARIQEGLGWEGAFAVMFLLYCAGCVLSSRRYK